MKIFRFRSNIFKALFFLLLLFKTNTVYSTTLPEPVIQWFKAGYTVQDIRFDGMITLKSGVHYIPVILLAPKSVENQDFTVSMLGLDTKYPEVIMFGNSYAFFKVITVGGHDTLYAKDIPINVKLGLLPQDFIVPTNFYIPHDLVGLLGDLNIPMIDAVETPTVKTVTQSSSPQITVQKENQEPAVNNVSSTKYSQEDPVVTHPAQDVQTTEIHEDATAMITQVSTDQDTSGSSSLVPMNEPLNKLLFTISNNIDTLTVVDLEHQDRMLNYLKVGILPYALEVSKKYLFVVSHKEGILQVFDLNTLELIKSIETGKNPSQVVLSPIDHKVLVANEGSKTITVIDSETLEVLQTVELPFEPDKLVPLSDGTGFIVSYLYSGIINRVEYNNPQNVMYLGKIKGLTDLVLNKSNTALYALSRSLNSIVFLEINYNNTKKRYEGVVLNNKEEFGKKPVKVALSDDENTIYVLCAGDTSVYYINAHDLSVIKSIALNTDGFPVDFVKTQNGKLIVADAEKTVLSVVNLAQGQVEETIYSGTVGKKITTAAKYGQI